MTVETHGLQFVVDTSNAQKGFRDYKSAVEGIFSSLDKFEAKVANTMKNVASAANNKAALSSFKNSLAGFGDVSISASTIKNISAMSAAMRDFKAPSSSQSANLKTFLSSLKGMPDLTAAYRTIKSIDDLNVAMRGFKAPPVTQAQNLLKFAQTIQKAVPMLNGLGAAKNVSQSVASLASLGTVMARFKPPTAAQITNLGNFALALQHLKFGNLAGSGNFFATLASIGQFKAPSAAQVKNLVNFADAVGKIKVPANGTGIATYLQQISTAAAAANGNMVKFRGGMGQSGSNFGSFTSGAHSARLEMMGLQNAFSGTFQVGSVLRSLLGSLTLGELGREFFSASQTANQFAASMETISNADGFKEAMWTHAAQAANKFGAPLPEYAESFAKFAAAAHESGVSVAETSKIFEGFQTAETGLHLGTEQQQSVGLAIREIMDRGYISTQQLTRQLGLVLPGALSTLKAAWKDAGVSQDSFFDALKKKEVDGQWGLDVLASHYKETYGPALAQALQSPIQQFNILKNNITQMMIAIGDSGAKKAFADLIAQFSADIDPAKTEQFAQAIGHGLADAVNKVADAVHYLHDNWDSIKGPLTTALKLFGEWMVLSASWKIGTTLVSPFLQVAGAMKTFTGSLGTVTTGFSGLTAGTKPLNTGLASLNVGAQAARVGMNALTVAGNTAKGAFNGFASLFGGTLGLALTAAATGIGLVAAEAFSLHEAMNRTDGVITSSNELLTTLGLRSNGAANGAASLAQQHQDAIKPITDFAGATGAAATELYRLADAQQKAALSKIVADEQDIIGQYNKVLPATTKGRAALANKPLYSISDAYNVVKTGLGLAANDIVTGENDRYANGKAAMLQQQLRADKQAFATLSNRPKEQFVTPGDRVMTDGMDHTQNPLYAGGDDKKKKTKKDHELSQLESMENGIDSMMSKLSQDDPAEKLTEKFTADVTKIGQALFKNKDTYKSFLNDLATSGATSQGEVDALTKAINKGGIDPKVLSDLEKRFHVSGTDLIAKLQAYADATEQKIRDAIVKAANDKYKKQDAAYAKVAEADPTKKIDLESASTLRTDAATFLKAGSKDEQDQIKSYIDSLQKLKAGTDDVESAAGDLSAMLRKQGGDAVFVADAVEQYGRAQAFARQEAERAVKFGGTLLYQQQQEILMTSQSARDQRVLTELETAVQERKKAGLEVTRQMIDGLRSQIELNDKLLQTEKARMEWVANNGVKAYINGVEQAGTAINNLDKNFLQTVEDQLVSLGKTGKFSFSTIFQTIQDGMLKFGAQSIVKSIVGPLTGANNSETPTIFGRLFPGAYKAPTPITNQDKSGRRLTVSTQDGGLVPDSKTEIVVEAAAQTFSTKLQDQNPTIATSFQTAITDTFPDISTAWQTAMMPPGSSPIIGANAPVPVAGGLTAANDNNLVAQWNKIKLTPDHLSLSSLSSDATSLTATTKAQEKADNQIVKNAGTFSSAMTSMIPMIAMTFGSAFKSPIAQIATTFGGMIVQQLLMSKSGSSSGGLGSILGSLFKVGTSLIPSGGLDFGSGIGDVPDLVGNSSVAADITSLPSVDLSGYKEGGIVGSAVNSYRVSPASFVNAPHYAEGTPNTSGGHPAILHDNEAVIPLSRGRKVAVELNGGAPAGPTQQAPTINLPNVAVNVHNYGDGKAKVQQSQNSDGSLNLDVIIERIETQLAGNVNKGGSPLNSAIEKRYNVSAASGNYR